MRMSGLSDATSVPVPTLKYYLREGLLHQGTPLSKTQSEYDESHVERVRLIRALGESGGLSLATIRRVLDAIADPNVERLGVLGAAHQSLYTSDVSVAREALDLVSTDDESASRSRRFAARRGWKVDTTDPKLDVLDAAWAACDDADIGLDEARMDAYADAMEQIATVDVGGVPDDPQAAVRQVILGTVLVDPVLTTLRRLAQAHVSISHELASDPGGERG